MRNFRLIAWLSEARNLRRFAAWNVIFWLVNQPAITLWFLVDEPSFRRYGVFYISEISVAALWLSSLAWWQSTRVEERQIEAEPS